MTNATEKPALSPELAALVKRWPELPEHRRRAILDLAGVDDNA